MPVMTSSQTMSVGLPTGADRSGDCCGIKEDDPRKLIEKDSHSYVKVAICDIDGLLRGKQISKNKLRHAIDRGIGFSDVILGWDIRDNLYENGKISSWDTGYGDIPVKADLSTCRINPLDGNSLLLIGDLHGRLKEFCPRGLLRRVVGQAASLGLAARVSCEYEFVVFRETPSTIREKEFRNLIPVSHSVQAYSLAEASLAHDFFQEIVDTCELMGLPIETIHPESGPGVYEAALVHSDPLSAADRAVLFKMTVKSLALKRGWLATFMPKISRTAPGQGAHIHVSLTSLDGLPQFYDASAPGGVSLMLRHFLGGIQRLMPEIMCMTVPTINGFKRLMPDFWAPTNSEWGIENRTCGLRIIGDTPSSMHVEYRLSGADINPYIAISAVLASGLWGIENRIEPREPVAGNAYGLTQPKDTRLPASLDEATKRFKDSVVAKRLFGAGFVEHFALSREWEASQYAQHISTWELDRYLENL